MSRYIYFTDNKIGEAMSESGDKLLIYSIKRLDIDKFSAFCSYGNILKFYPLPGENIGGTFVTGSIFYPSIYRLKKIIRKEATCRVKFVKAFKK